MIIGRFRIGVRGAQQRFVLLDDVLRVADLEHGQFQPIGPAGGRVGVLSQPKQPIPIPHMEVLGKAGNFQLALYRRGGRIAQTYREKRIHLAEGDEIAGFPVEPDGIDPFSRGKLFDFPHGFQPGVQHEQIVPLLGLEAGGGLAVRVVLPALAGGDDAEISSVFIHGELVEDAALHLAGGPAAHDALVRGKPGQPGDALPAARNGRAVAGGDIQAVQAGVQGAAAVQHGLGGHMPGGIRRVRSGDHQVLGGGRGVGDIHAARRDGGEGSAGQQAGHKGAGFLRVALAIRIVAARDIQVISHHAGGQIATALA